MFGHQYRPPGRRRGAHLLLPETAKPNFLRTDKSDQTRLDLTGHRHQGPERDDAGECKHAHEGQQLLA